MNRLILAFLMFSSFCAVGQEVDYNDIIKTQGSGELSFAERLVRLAWENNPANRMVESQQRISNMDVDLARWSWLDNFRVTGNLNEFTINPDQDVLNRSAFYPKYNLSAVVSLGYFVNIPKEVKKNKELRTIAGYSIDQQKLAIRAEVLRRYEEYLMSREILKVESEAQEDLFANVSLIEQNFRNGSATLEEYNYITEKYNSQRVRKITAQGNHNQAKITLEEIIGVRLEDVR